MANQVPRQSETVRDGLRVHTHDAHEQLHQHSSFVALFQETLTLDDYRDLMRRFYGFYVPLDDAIQRALSEIAGREAGFDYPLRASLLAQDLGDLGFSKQEIETTPLCEHLHNVVTAKSLGGVLYVIEGSTLGAAPIDRAAHKLLKSADPKGRQFWAWSRAQNKQRWKAANAYLEHLKASGAAQDDLAIGARETFQTLADWLAPLDQSHVPRKELHA